jgi:predicted phage terminase large subunit-like protein
MSSSLAAQERRLIELATEETLELARKGLLTFTAFTKPNYEINWHHRELCRVLNRFIRGEIKRLMIFMPPRHGKSELVSRRLPAMLHGLYPNDEIMSATYNNELAADMTADVQRIMERPSYQLLFPESKITPEGTVSRFARNAHEHELIPVKRADGSMFYPEGSYRSQGIGGTFTGRGANWILVDDPYKGREEADSKAVREAVWKFYTGTLYTRQEKDASILITMTRWHEDDLAGRLLAQAKADPEADQWEVVSFPAIRETLDNPRDPRPLGEALWPAKKNREALLKNKKLGIRDWSSIWQQNPQVEGGNVIKESWFKFYKTLPTRFDQVVDSWDFAVKDKKGADFNVGLKLGRLGADKYLIHQERGQWPFPVTCQKVVELRNRKPVSTKLLFEAKANGPAVKQTLQSYVSGIVEIEPRGDKLARTHAVSPEIQGGNVWLPHPEIAPWIVEWLAEVCAFPAGVHDDRVDALTQALDELRKASVLYVPLSGHGTGVVYSGR